MKIKVKDNQTIYDIALMYTGGIDSVMDILLHNGKTDDTLLIDEIIEIPYVVNQSIVDYFAAQGISIATSTEPLDPTQYVPEPPKYQDLTLISPFKTGDDTITFNVVTDSDGTIDSINSGALTNVVIKVNATVVAVPFSIEVGDTIEITFDAAGADGVIKLEGSYV